MVKDHSGSERGNPLLPHQGFFYMHHPTDRIAHTNDLCYTSHGALAGTRNSSMGPPHEGSIRRPVAPWANAPTTELHLAPTHHKDKNEEMGLKAVPFRREVSCRDDHVIPVVDQNGNLAAARGLEDSLQQLQRVVEDVGRTHVNLGDHHKHGNVQRKRQAEVLFRHSYNTCIRAHLSS